jgi:long-chain fatty acid transport protein
VNGPMARQAGGAALLLLCAPSGAHASYGIFAHGTGIESLGMGGLSFIAVSESYTAPTNPARLHQIGNRYDIGLDWLFVTGGGTIRDNAAGPDERFYSHGRRHFYVPQAGMIRRINDRLTLGIAGFSAGVGSDYKGSPYVRFGGDERAGLLLSQSGIATALSWQVLPEQALGLSLNLAYQLYEAKGLDVFSTNSQNPGRFSDQGKGEAFGIGYTLGWSGQLLPWLEGALSYRSKTYSERTKRYEGLLPNRGLLETPAIWGGALAVVPAPGWVIAVEGQRIEYASEAAYGNSIRQLTEQGIPFGAENGPGFGWRDQNIWKIGVSYQATPKLVLRTGASYGTELIPRSETFLSMLAAGIGRKHYTFGATYDIGGWELSGYYAFMVDERVHGVDSIPDAFGGGEADLRFRLHPFGISFGRRFGAQ